MRKPKLARIELNVLPTKIYFCPDEDEWNKHTASLGFAGWPYPVSDAAVSHFKRPGEVGFASVVMTVADRHYTGDGTTRVAGLIVHEVVHLVARIREDIGDTEGMGEEYEAYLHQFLFERMWLEYSRSLAYRRIT